MLSIATGHDPGYLTKAVAGGREGYYTGAEAVGEPPGLWYGAGSELLGLHGQVDAELMEAVYSHLLDPRDAATHARATWGEASPLAAGHRKYRTAEEIYVDLWAAHPEAGPEEQAQLKARAERSARQAVAFYDVTFSAPKSVTVLGVAFERAENDARKAGDAEAAQAWGAHRQAVEDAVLAGARASIDYLADVAGYARVGHHGGGAGRWTDAHEWVIAQFLQHDSRDRDPQLHVHQAMLNRVPLLDRLTDDGHLTPTQRLDLAADPALSGLDRLLRSCELAGHNPDALLSAVVTARRLDGADHPAQVLHARITKALDGTRAPHIASYAELIPTDIVEHRQDRLHTLAEAADNRRRELGAQTAEHPRNGLSKPSGRYPTTPWPARSGSTAPAGPPPTASSPTSPTTRTRSARRPRPVLPNTTPPGTPPTPPSTCPTAAPTNNR